MNVEYREVEGEAFGAGLPKHLCPEVQAKNYFYIWLYQSGVSDFSAADTIMCTRV